MSNRSGFCTDHQHPEPCPVCAGDVHVPLVSARPNRASFRERPPLFDERNRMIWDGARRFMIYILKELDHWYGWRTFSK